MSASVPAAPTLGIEEFIQRFDEEPGYLDFARVGPLGRTVREEAAAMLAILGRARFGSLDVSDEQDARLRQAVGALLGFRPDQIVAQPNTSQGLMHTMFGLSGEIALSPAEFPSNTFAVSRAQEALKAVTPLWLQTDHGRVTPGNLREQLTPSTVAVVVSLVDFRTGYRADLDGIRQVIGDRLLIVDAIQGFGVSAEPWEVADVIVSGGQKWVRAGWGTGFLALSDRVAERLVPVFSGFSATAAEGIPLDEVLPPAAGASAFQISGPDPAAQARFAAALEEIAAVGVDEIARTLAQCTATVIDLADEFGIGVVSPRDEAERAGIVVLAPEAERLTALTAALHNNGVSVTTRQGRVRLSPHVTTGEDSFEMLRASFSAFTAAS